MATRPLKCSPFAKKKAKDERFRACISRAQVESGVKNYEMEKAMRVTAPTRRAKFRNPDDMTIGEFRRLRELIGISDDELREII